MMKARVVFLGTPEFACPTLDALLAEPEHYDVAAVVTQPDRPAGRNLELKASKVKLLAENVQISRGNKFKKFPILTPESVNDPKVLKQLGDLKADIAVVVAFGQILSPAFLALFPHGAVNVHASVLPRWRGAAPIPWAILSEDPVTGVTLQKVAPKLDSGDIIAYSQVDLDDSWDAPRLYAELARRGAEVVRKSLLDYIAGKVKTTPQNESQITWAPKIKKEQGLVDWNLRAHEICARIRAFTPWPGVWTTRDGKALKILRASPLEFKSSQKPGYLVSQDKYGFAVQCGGSTALLITVLQPESRARQPAGAYLKGYPFKKGERLGD
jgi:methionyl-tRNA formyltransferase